MKASQARQIADKGCYDNQINPILTFVLKKIEDAANNGDYHLNYPYDNYPDDYVQRHLQEKIEAQLTILGYNCTYNESQDPGHPTDRPITIIKW